MSDHDDKQRQDETPPATSSWQRAIQLAKWLRAHRPDREETSDHE